MKDAKAACLLISTAHVRVRVWHRGTGGHNLVGGGRLASLAVSPWLIPVRENMRQASSSKRGSIDLSGCAQLTKLALRDVRRTHRSDHVAAAAGALLQQCVACVRVLVSFHGAGC